MKIADSGDSLGHALPSTWNSLMYLWKVSVSEFFIFTKFFFAQLSGSGRICKLMALSELTIT